MTIHLNPVSGWERLLFQFDPARVYVDLVSTERHHPAVGKIRRQIEQREQLAQGSFPSVLDWAFARCRLKTNDGDPPASLRPLLARPRICLFNVVIALEWIPTVSYLQDLRQAFDEAAELLFDVTDGYMTIGQVVVGGMELMDVADITIMASNRLFPRSQVYGMQDAAKYRPIRVGRGLWSKKRGRALNWSDTYGTLVHEFCHYALGLKDQYLQVVADQVVPTVSLAIDSIMAHPTKTELTGGHAPIVDVSGTPVVSEWQQLADRSVFAFLNIDPQHQPVGRPPFIHPRPAFRLVGITPMDQTLMFDLPTDLIDPDHCWIYVLRGSGDQAQLIGQGTTEEQPGTRKQMVLRHQLYGAQLGDGLLLVGNDQKAARVVYGTITEVSNGVAQVQWRDATPPEPWPAVAVRSASQPGKVLVEVIGGAPNPELTVFPLGEVGAASLQGAQHMSDMLDGSVLLRWGSGTTQQLLVAHYSLGGSPGSGFPVHPNPIPAGSAEGNAMIFFYDAALGQDLQSRPVGARDHSFYRIVTTTNYRLPLSRGLKPRSYSFTVTSNLSLTLVADLKPTLILYFDGNGEDLQIARQQGDAWVVLESMVDPKGFVSVRLHEQNAPGLFAEQPTAEIFRIVKVR